MGVNRVNMFNYLEQYNCIRDEILKAIERVLNSGQLILGAEVRKFEELFAEFLGGGGNCVGVNSGTDALVVALRALNVGLGDEVITVANTAVPTVSAIRAVGATPVFCDVDPQTCLMDLAMLPERITEKTIAIVPVHLFGNVVDVPLIRNIIGKRKIYIIEDCAQAHGAKLRGHMAGTMGNISIFSFYPTKNLGAYGDAGLCYSHDTYLVQEMCKIRMYGFIDQPYSEREGINSRMDEIQAAILQVKLKYLPVYLNGRHSLAVRYSQTLIHGAEPVAAGDGVYHAYHLYVIKVEDRDRVKKELDRHGVDTGIHYPFPIHLMRGYSFLGYTPSSLPHTEDLACRILSLPLFPELSEASVDRVCSEINSILQKE